MEYKLLKILKKECNGVVGDNLIPFCVANTFGSIFYDGYTLR